MSRIKELEEQRAELYAQMLSYHEQHTENWGAEDEQVWQELNAKYNGLLAEIDSERKKIEKQAERAAFLDQLRKHTASATFSNAAQPRGMSTGTFGAQPATFRPTSHPRDAFAAAIAEFIGGHGDETLRSIGGTVNNRSQASLPFHLYAFDLGPDMRWKAAMGTISGPAGGYTVPSTFLGQLEQAMLYYGPMLRLASTIQTDSGEEIVIHMVDDTANVANRIGENQDVGSATDITFAPLRLGAHMVTSGILRVPNTLLTDTSLPSFSSFVTGLLGERIGRTMNTLLTNGTGGSSPVGIVKAATLGKTTASATAITFDELIDLRHSIDPAYRQQPSTAWMMHDQVLAAIRKLKDSNNRYLWTESNIVGDPDRIMGFPVYINNDMESTIASGKITVLFGDFSKYYVRLVGQMQVTQLQERYAEYMQTGFVIGLRFDGALLDAGTHPVKYLKQA